MTYLVKQIPKRRPVRTLTGFVAAVEGDNLSKVDIREEQLLVELKQRGQMDLREIIELFHISDSTARRMCVELERKDLAIRTFGGLRVLPDNDKAASAPYSYYISETENAEEKQKIGKYAAELVNDGDIIFLSGGTTVQCMAVALAQRMDSGKLKNVMILTSSIACAEMLAPHCSVMLTGGKLRPERRDVAGFLSEQMVRNARFDKSFIGVDGIDLHDGLMAFDVDTANLDRIVIDQSDKAYILADNSKFHRTYFTAYERVVQKHIIVTDDGIDPKTLVRAREDGVLIKVV